MLSVFLKLIGCLSLLGIVACAAADEKAAEEVLKGKGLRRSGAYFVLAAELDVGKKLRDAEPLRKKVNDAQREANARQQKVDDKQKTIIACLQQRRQLSAQLPLAKTVDAHNRMVSAINELGDRIMLLEKSTDEEDALKAAQGAANQIAEQYVEHVLATRKLYDQVKADYDALTTDAQVQEALAECGQASGKACKLGPAATFAAADKRLKKLEEAVLSESIDLRAGAGNLWHVSVVFNGKGAQEMAIDTGASIVTLPWKTAQAVGLAPKPGDPKLQLQMADGTVVEGQKVVAQTVRVGKFTAKNVECAVMPADLAQAAPLLGLSFFKHFTYKIDTANSKLIMSKVETAEQRAK